MNTMLDHLRGAYPHVFEGAKTVRTMDFVPGLIGSVTEIIYDNGKVRSIQWTDRTDLQESLTKLEEELSDDK